MRAEHRPEPLCCSVLPSPVGSLTIIAADAGLRAVLWPHERLDDPASRVPIALPPGTEMRDPDAFDTLGQPRSAVLAQAIAELREYFSGDRTEFDVAVDAVGTPFQRLAWRALTEIPYGETVSYGEQARRLGDPNKARAVGAANGRNPVSIIVPCHRVIGANGSLTGFGGGMAAKAFLLDLERQVSKTTLF